jgi:hypothetical protein
MTAEKVRFGDFVVTPESERYCILWTRRLNSYGYGEFTRNHKRVAAHRDAWEKAFGPIPKGMHVLHRCDNRACINATHMFLGTNLDNIADRVRKNRSARLLGENNRSSKLTSDQVRLIRTLASAGVSQRKIAAQFGINQTMVSLIHLRKKWRHL